MLFYCLILEIIIPIFTFRVVSIINAGLIRISFKLINNESVKFVDVYSPQYFYSKLDEQTRKFSLFSGLLIFSPFLLFGYSVEHIILSIIIYFIIWPILFSGSIFVGHLIIDKKLGIIKAFTKSFMLTTGFVSLFRLLVLSIFQFITFFGIFIVVILILSIFWGYEKLTYFDFFLIIFLMLIISFIIPILSLIISYFYKKLVEQVETNT